MGDRREAGQEPLTLQRFLRNQLALAASRVDAAQADPVATTAAMADFRQLRRFYDAAVRVPEIILYQNHTQVQTGAESTLPSADDVFSKETVDSSSVQTPQVGDVINTWRTVFGIPLSKLSEMSGVDENTIAALEEGSVDVSLEAIDKVSAALARITRQQRAQDEKDLLAANRKIAAKTLINRKLAAENRKLRDKLAKLEAGNADRTQLARENRRLSGQIVADGTIIERQRDILADQRQAIGSLQRENKNLKNSIPLVGALVKASRELCDLTQKQLATMAGVNYRQVSSLENAGPVSRTSRQRILSTVVQLSAEKLSEKSALEVPTVVEASVVKEKDMPRETVNKLVTAWLVVSGFSISELASLAGVPQGLMDILQAEGTEQLENNDMDIIVSFLRNKYTKHLINADVLKSHMAEKRAALRISDSARASQLGIEENDLPYYDAACALSLILIASR